MQHSFREPMDSSEALTRLWKAVAILLLVLSFTAISASAPANLDNPAIDEAVNVTPPVELSVRYSHPRITNNNIIFFRIWDNNTYSRIGSCRVKSGSRCGVNWTNLKPGSSYRYKAMVRVGRNLSRSETWRFTTKPTPPPESLNCQCVTSGSHETGEVSFDFSCGRDPDRVKLIGGEGGWKDPSSFLPYSVDVEKHNASMNETIRSEFMLQRRNGSRVVGIDRKTCSAELRHPKESSDTNISGPDYPDRDTPDWALCKNPEKCLIVNGTEKSLHGIQNYKKVLVINGGVLHVTDYREGGGKLVLASDSIYVDSKSRIDAEGRGLPGGESPICYPDRDKPKIGRNGTGISEGEGGGGASGKTHTPVERKRSDVGAGGGGGGHAARGVHGDPSHNQNLCAGGLRDASCWAFGPKAGRGGRPYGSRYGSKNFLGSGGGAGGCGALADIPNTKSGPGGRGGEGGDGGGAVTLKARDVIIEGVIDADGEEGGAGEDGRMPVESFDEDRWDPVKGTAGGGGGGGSGGGIKIIGKKVDIPGSLTAKGGEGGRGGSENIFLNSTPEDDNREVRSFGRRMEGRLLPYSLVSGISNTNSRQGGAGSGGRIKIFSERTIRADHTLGNKEHPFYKGINNPIIDSLGTLIGYEAIPYNRKRGTFYSDDIKYKEPQISPFVVSESAPDLVAGNRSSTVSGDKIYDEVRVVNGSTLRVRDFEKGDNTTGRLNIKANTVVVDEDSRIVADGSGYSPGSGPGAPTSKRGNGGAYGGLGYFNPEKVGSGRTYGTQSLMEISRGSGGGGGSGGGAVDIRAREIEVKGTISSKGKNSSDGGGSGGGVMVIGENVRLDNASARGGGAGGGTGLSIGDQAGGGGGGRIKVFAEHLSGNQRFSVSGGGSEIFESKGTIWKESIDYPDVNTSILDDIVLTPGASFDVFAQVSGEPILASRGAVVPSACNVTVKDRDGNAETYRMDMDKQFGDREEAQCIYTGVSVEDNKGWNISDRLEVEVKVMFDTGDQYSRSIQYSFPVENLSEDTEVGYISALVNLSGSSKGIPAGVFTIIANTSSYNQRILGKVNRIFNTKISNGTASVNIGNVSRGERIDVNFESNVTDSALVSVEFTAENNISDAGLDVSELDEKPEGVEPPNESLISDYWHVIPSNISEEDVRDVEFVFEVSKDRVGSIKHLEDRAILLKSSGGEWVALDMSMVAETEDSFVIEASSSSLSYLAVALKEDISQNSDYSSFLSINALVLVILVFVVCIILGSRIYGGD